MIDPVRKRGSKSGWWMGAGLMGLVMLSLGAPDACSVSSEEVIGPDGGIVRSDDGRFTLEIPAGALSSDVEIAIEDVECDQPGAADCYRLTPEGLPFAFPAKATYEAGELEQMDGVSVAVKGAEGWTPLADLVVDMEDEIVMASVLYLSSYAIVSD